MQLYGVNQNFKTNNHFITSKFKKYQCSNYYCELLADKTPREQKIFIQDTCNILSENISHAVVCPSHRHSQSNMLKLLPKSDFGLGRFSPLSRRFTGDMSVVSTRSAHLTLISDFGLSGLGDGDFLLLVTFELSALA